MHTIILTDTLLNCSGTLRHTVKLHWQLTAHSYFALAPYGTLLNCTCTLRHTVALHWQLRLPVKLHWHFTANFVFHWQFTEHLN
jgi:hypothetical protein